MKTFGKLRGTYATDSGMLCVWRRDAFQSIHDYDTWDKELCEDRDIRRHIRSGDLVPINIRSDGAFEVEVRAEPEARLSDREKRYLVVSSKPYLFRSSGEIHLGGLEHIEKRPGRGTGKVKLPRGDYAVTIYLIGWDEEPGAKDRKGHAKPGALPDFVVLVRPEAKRRGTYRTQVDTFERPRYRGR